jgi:DNA-binding transcriptional ArsR family regulator
MTDGSAKAQGLLGLDRIIHEPARLAILTILAAVAEVEFKYLEEATGLTKGNISSHASRLEEAGYVEVMKAFRGKVPVTSFRLTPKGRQAFHAYRIRLLAGVESGGKTRRS